MKDLIIFLIALSITLTFFPTVFVLNKIFYDFLFEEHSSVEKTLNSITPGFKICSLIFLISFSIFIAWIFFKTF